jgi:outer membrane protein assembly factor BamD
MKPVNRRISISLLLSVLLLTLGLACKQPTKAKIRVNKKNLTAPQLLLKGELELKRKRWEDGRETLKLIEEYFPSSDEFPQAKLLIADSYFYASKNSYPEAEVEYTSFLNYFPRHPRREYTLSRIALCHYATIENGERDQTATYKAIEAFNRLLQEYPGTPYATDVRAKINQCWRRLAERELAVGIFYVNAYQYLAAETRLKGMLETYPEHADRERAYYYLGEALRLKWVSPDLIELEYNAYLESINKMEDSSLTSRERRQWILKHNAFIKAELKNYQEEAKSYYQRLVESYPASLWAGRARDRLIELGQANVGEELDS